MPVTCLTESTKAAVVSLVAEGRYTPCGIGFSKQFVFNARGGPALYVRGDEWPLVANVEQPIRARIVRFWPGADPDEGEVLTSNLSGPSEWLHEREWRVPGDLAFNWQDVKFLIVPHPSWQSYYASWIGSWAGEGYAQYFESIPAVVMNVDGSIALDELGIWSE